MAVRDSGLHTHVTADYVYVSKIIVIRYLFGPAEITKLQSRKDRNDEDDSMTIKASM